jgi:N-acetylglucosamine-6-sulfatase
MAARRVSTRHRPRLLASLLAGLATPTGVRGAAPDDRPDIVVLLLNDARDGDQVAMPQTMARLAGGGTTFPNCFLTTPLCCPSRASIFTGLYPHNHGVYDNRSGPNGGWEGFARRGNRDRTIGAILQEAGYFTAAVGGYLNGNAPGAGSEPGWDIGPSGGRRKRRGKGKRGGKGKNRRRVRRSGIGQPASAGAAIAAAPADRPLLLHVGFDPPHVPANPAPPYAGRFAGTAIDRADPSFDEADVSDKPKYVSGLRRLTGGEVAWLDDLHQRRLETLLGVDDEIAAIWRALEARGRLENTYVFLLTDNGYLMGHHRLYGKMAPYDGAVRFPLFAFGPRFAAGAVDRRLVGNIDLAPTIVALAGAAAPPMDGRSLLAGHARDAILIELLGRDLETMDWPGERADVPRYAALRTAGHLYVEYESGARELYDHRRDPREVENLLVDPVSPADAALAGRLSARLAALRGCQTGSCV